MSGELAGRLRERVALERRSDGRDALGGATGEWNPLGESWAAIEPHGSGPTAAGEAASAMPRWRVTMRAGIDMMVGDRLHWGVKRLRVRAMLADPMQADRVTAEVEEER